MTASTASGAISPGDPFGMLDAVAYYAAIQPDRLDRRVVGHGVEHAEGIAGRDRA